MFSEVGELEFLLANPFCGGAPEGDEASGSEAQATSEGEQIDAEAQQRAASDNGRQAGQEHMIPKHRFDEVNQRFNAYKGFGSPEELKQKLERLAQLEANPQNRYTKSQTDEIRADILRVLPELQTVLATRETQEKNFVSYGVKQNEKFMAELGIEVNQNNNEYLQELIGGVIARSPELRMRFLAQDQTVFADAFKQTKAVFWPNAKRVVPGLDKVQAKAAAKPAITKPAAQQASVDGPIDRLAEREILNKAGEDAFAMISSQME